MLSGNPRSSTITFISKKPEIAIDKTGRKNIKSTIRKLTIFFFMGLVLEGNLNNYFDKVIIYSSLYQKFRSIKYCILKLFMAFKENDSYAIFLSISSSRLFFNCADANLL